MELFDFLKEKRPTEAEKAAEISKIWKYLSAKTRKMEMKIKEKEAKKATNDQLATSKIGLKRAEKRKRSKAQLEGPSTSSKQVAGAASAEYAYKPKENEKSAEEGEASDVSVDQNKGAEKKNTKEKLNLSVYDFPDEQDYEADEETEEGCKMT